MNFKKYLLVILCTISSNLYSQSNILKTNPILFTFGFINLTYERALNLQTSISAGMGFTTNDGGELAATIEYRFYITNKKLPSPEGFFAGVNALLLRERDLNFSLGGLLGYQWIWSSGMTMDLGVGPRYHFISDSYNGDVIPYGIFSIGYNW